MPTSLAQVDRETVSIHTISARAAVLRVGAEVHDLCQGPSDIINLALAVLDVGGQGRSEADARLVRAIEEDEGRGSGSESGLVCSFHLRP